MLEKLLITGANGNLGSVCRKQLKTLAKTLRLSDRSGLGDAADHEEIVCCDLSDQSAVEALVEGCDGIVHMGGKDREGKWETIRNSNIEGLFNLYEAARKSSVTPRIVFASSNHVIGGYPVNERLDANSLPWPDGLYGLSKMFGEGLAQIYFDKFGIETACIRIGSCFPEPTNRRMLSTWMSHDDLMALIRRIFAVTVLGCPVIYGVSANSAAWWDNHKTQFLGWKPKDSADQFQEKIEAEQPVLDPADTANRYQGGAMRALGILTED